MNLKQFVKFKMQMSKLFIQNKAILKFRPNQILLNSQKGDEGIAVIYPQRITSFTPHY